MTIHRANQVWALDTTYIPLAKGFAYLTAVVDWASRKVLAAKVAITLEACHAAVAALLHDAVEDAETTDEANRRRDLIREAFGERVATIVEGYTDGAPDSNGVKPDWHTCKRTYLAHLKPPRQYLVGVLRR
ncbi:DDE-type integrase/transposase/recombinase [Methylomonas koyamae]|uniref:DDE-type integrase/transposase/recombinase n=1 Tax=Methylomonas koyamae TaxID=702114 RepID=UPI001C3395B7|nr:DDE-type integrase/transposase/recombinase [Methylomonas koyamae]BBL56415.1 hypothetical protein MKFW12EY_00280 [Methylomonas koyamae]